MTIHLSCGHVAEDGCLGVHVEFQDETCVAGEGFVPCTVNAVYCHKCAMDLAAAEERAKIVAWLRNKDTYDFDDLAIDIEAGEHLK